MLHRLLAEENKLQKNIARQTSSRHSRFGTTISVSLKSGPSSSAAVEETTSSSSNNQRLILHNQQAIKADSGAIVDMVKKAKTRKIGGRDGPELSRTDNLGVDARRALQTLAREFIKSCFNRELIYLHALL
jgi:replication fork protection complex subunit Tof1/Swi1